MSAAERPVPLDEALDEVAAGQAVLSALLAAFMAELVDGAAPEAAARRFLELGGGL